MTITGATTPSRIAKQARNESITDDRRAAVPAMPRTYHFDLLRDGNVVGGGVIIAASPASAVRSATLLLAGGADVRLRGNVAGRAHTGGPA